MKLWHDDIRPPPDSSWTWVRTNSQAKAFLLAARKANAAYEEISLDHDLGLDYIDPKVYESRPEELWVLRGEGKETGLDLVHWMCENDLVPSKVTIHSWNPAGAENMAARLNNFGHDCTIAPFKTPMA